MALTWSIQNKTRVNTMTSLSVSTKTLTAVLDGVSLPHEYVFDSSVTDAAAQAAALADLTGSKGYII